MSPYIFIHDSINALEVSIAIAVIVLFGIGAWKTTLTKTNWFKGNFETVVLGSLAAGVGYVFGWIFSVTI